MAELLRWLERRWSSDNPCTFELGHGGRVLVRGKSRDEVFRVCEWIRNQNPLGKLAYQVTGYRDGAIIYVSWCPRCRRGEPHGRHRG